MLILFDLYAVRMSRVIATLMPLARGTFVRYLYDNDTMVLRQLRPIGCMTAPVECPSGTQGVDTPPFVRLGV